MHYTVWKVIHIVVQILARALSSVALKVGLNDRNILVFDIVIALWVAIGVGMVIFVFNFHWTK